jgi:transcriptional regulator with XRE-family HTH domain
MDHSGIVSFLKERRTLLGLTQQALSDLSGVTLRTIKNIEGGALPSVRNLMLVAEALGLELKLEVKKMSR